MFCSQFVFYVDAKRVDVLLLARVAGSKCVLYTSED
jgi:hypothetical protein